MCASLEVLISRMLCVHNASGFARTTDRVMLTCRQASSTFTRSSRARIPHSARVLLHCVHECRARSHNFPADEISRLTLSSPREPTDLHIIQVHSLSLLRTFKFPSASGTNIPFLVVCTLIRELRLTSLKSASRRKLVRNGPASPPPFGDWYQNMQFTWHRSSTGSLTTVSPKSLYRLRESELIC
jgi:hypothetical protein